jgi:hypothetical protein
MDVGAMTPMCEVTRVIEVLYGYLYREKSIVLHFAFLKKCERSNDIRFIADEFGFKLLTLSHGGLFFLEWLDKLRNNSLLLGALEGTIKYQHCFNILRLSEHNNTSLTQTYSVVWSTARFSSMSLRSSSSEIDKKDAALEVVNIVIKLS